MKTEDKIPKIIHYCWFGKNELGEKEKKCINSWKKIMPDYKIIKWDESNYDISKNNFVKDAYNNKKWAFVSDYARLDIIYNYGGIYLDTDVEVLKSFDDLLDNNCFMGFENTNYISTGLGFGAKKGNKFIKKNLDSYDNIVFDINNLNSISCPKITTNLLYLEGFKINNTYQKNRMISLYPKDYFCPKDYYTGKMHITNNTHSIHHYSMTWISNYDKFWYNISKRMSKFFGKKISNAITLLIKLPFSIFISIKKNGFKLTIESYRKKLKRSKR